jgi:hypothetical protein
MKQFAIIFFVSTIALGCGGSGEEAAYDAEPAAEAALLEVEAPPALEVPEPREVTADDDWEAKAHNKNIEVLGVINIINPVAAYIVEGFKQYGDSFSPTLHEEWEDTQVQLTAATTLYDSCKERMAAGDYNKQQYGRQRAEKTQRLKPNCYDGLRIAGLLRWRGSGLCYI